MASAAAGGASVEVGVADPEAGSEVGVVDEFDYAFVEFFGCSFVIEHVETIGGFVYGLAIVGLLLEAHPELGPRTGHSREVDFDAVTYFAVLFEKVIDELLRIRCDLDHSYRTLDCCGII